MTFPHYYSIHGCKHLRGIYTESPLEFHEVLTDQLGISFETATNFTYSVFEEESFENN